MTKFQNFEDVTAIWLFSTKMTTALFWRFIWTTSAAITGSQHSSLVADRLSAPWEHGLNPGGGKIFPLLFLSHNLMIVVNLQIHS